MPNTPHSSLNLSSMSGHFPREDSLDRRGPHPLGVVHQDDRQPRGRRRQCADGSRRFRQSRERAPAPRRPLQNLGDVVGTGDTTTREADSPKSAAASFSRDAAPTFGPVNGHLRARPEVAEAALRQRHRQAAIRTVVRGANGAGPNASSTSRFCSASFRWQDPAAAGGHERDRARARGTRCRRARRGLRRAATITSPDC